MFLILEHAINLYFPVEQPKPQLLKVKQILNESERGARQIGFSNRETMENIEQVLVYVKF